MLKANEVKITITVVNRSFNKITFGPLLSGEVVKTINIPMMPKATDAQTKTFVAIFCIVLSISNKILSANNAYVLLRTACSKQGQLEILK